MKTFDCIRQSPNKTLSTNICDEMWKHQLLLALLARILIMFITFTNEKKKNQILQIPFIFRFAALLLIFPR